MRTIVRLETVIVGGVADGARSCARAARAAHKLALAPGEQWLFDEHVLTVAGADGREIAIFGSSGVQTSAAS